MSIYGDRGNILILKTRLEKLGFRVLYQTVNIGEDLPELTDLYFIGGGQDHEQFLICQDLLEKRDKLFEDIESGVALLSVCGGYQLLGQSFITGSGQEIPGLEIFPVVTRAMDEDVKSRCVGNIITKCMLPGLEDVYLVGFENHSGQTYFTNLERARPLGKVLLGYGNNVVQQIEGCVYQNAIGTYLHGPCLSKNPELANYLIVKAVDYKIQKKQIPQITLNFKLIDDTIAYKAKEYLLDKLL